MLFQLQQLSEYYRMFNQQELQILLGGVNSPIDLDDLRAHTQYGGLYSDQEPTIQVFWRVSINSTIAAYVNLLTETNGLQVVNSFNHEQRRALLRFATSCSRPPLL